MDEKTADLRDLFVDATGSESVTERQDAARGTLLDADEGSDDAAARDLVAAMRQRYGFSTDLDDDAYVLVARGRFDTGDEAIAAALRDAFTEEEDADVDPDEIDAETVRNARLDLHLVRESDREVGGDAVDTDSADAELAYADLKRLTGAGNSIVECAAELGAPPDQVARYAAVARTDIASTRANDRFRDAFRGLFTDDDIGEALASDAREDGLREATEDIETDVSL